MTNWDAIVANEGPLVWRVLWRLLGQREDVEECFQETFLAALMLSRREAVGCWPAWPSQWPQRVPWTDFGSGICAAIARRRAVTARRPSAG